MKHNNPWLEYADCVLITFEFQKKDKRDDAVTQMASGDLLLFPFRQYAKTVKHIWEYKGVSEETPVSAVWCFDKIDQITSKEMVNALRAAVFAFREDKLGIKPKALGHTPYRQELQWQ
eukprot:1373174-Ditylum_brightwellii.AAC.1